MYLNAQHRAKQGQTMANMRAIATAWEARASDVKAYNAAGADFAVPAVELSHDDMSRLLTPKYIPILPRYDAWGHPLEFRVDSSVTATAQQYSIRSPGRDGIFQTTGATANSYAEGAFECFDCDIVYADGHFAAWPQGAQH
jgi:hypothetical protein